MKKHLLILSLFCLPVFASAQNVYANPENRTIIKKDCGNKILDRIENPPSVSITEDEYAHKLETYLKDNNAFVNNADVTYKFVITSTSGMIGLTKEEGSYAHDKELQAAITKHADLWKPGTENKKMVCAYAHLEIKIKDNQLKVKYAK